MDFETIKKLDLQNQKP